MGIKGTVRRNQDGHFIHANIDLDIIITEEPEIGVWLASGASHLVIQLVWFFRMYLMMHFSPGTALALRENVTGLASCTRQHSTSRIHRGTPLMILLCTKYWVSEWVSVTTWPTLHVSVARWFHKHGYPQQYQITWTTCCMQASQGKACVKPL